MILPILLIGGGIAALAYVLSDDDEGGPVPNHEPDYNVSYEGLSETASFPSYVPFSPTAAGQLGKTGYKKIDAMLGDLQRASASSGIPLGLLVGWIAKESGGRIDEKPKPLKGETDGERGYFQLTPTESRGLGVDHLRLSTDHAYSIDAGIRLIQKYMKNADAFGVAGRGSPYYWRLVKLGHTMGSGATKIIVNGGKAAGAAGSWEDLERHALSNEARYKKATKHSPSKWFPLVDKVYQVGRPFGFGEEQVMVVGADAPAYNDIPDVLDMLPNRGRKR